MDQYDEWLRTITEELAGAQDVRQVADIRASWLGKKGRIVQALKALGSMAADDRRRAGQALNILRDEAERLVAESQARLKEQEETGRLAAERLDMTMPGRMPATGMAHPLTRVRRKIEDVLLRMGFSLQYGPEIESVWYNFEALGMPDTHPARDMHDSFFVDVPGKVLRTHTSPVQIRAMEAHGGQLPVKVLAPGFVYRRDDDATHTPMFAQIEGLVIDRGISLADLKGTLITLTRDLLGSHVGTRFRPSYFPFTEPSVEMDVTCAVCGGAGCRTCKGTGWVEILGSGIVHPQVLKNGGYDPDVVSGFAFGMGIERIAMRLLGLDDLRVLYQNDLIFLQSTQLYEGGDGR